LTRGLQEVLTGGQFDLGQIAEPVRGKLCHKLRKPSGNLGECNNQAQTNYLAYDEGYNRAVDLPHTYPWGDDPFHVEQAMSEWWRQ
jgi:hypothetical protein